VIIGTTGITYTIDQGAFRCPVCSDVRPYARRRVKRSFSLFFIPILPLDDVADYVECRDCEQRFDPGVLTTHSVEGQDGVVRDVLRAACAAFAHIASPNAVLDAEPAAECARRIHQLFGGQGNLEALEIQLRRVEHDYPSLREALRAADVAMAHGGKEMFLRVALGVAMDLQGGPLVPASREALKEVGELIGMPMEEVQGLLHETEAAWAP
jgi:hypothetical protein